MATRILTRLSALTLPAIALLTFGSGSAAVAQTGERLSVNVKYSDLNLASDEGQKALRSRIKSAARKVCGAFDTRDLKARILNQECEKIAMRGAEIRADTVIAQYRADRKRAS